MDLKNLYAILSSCTSQFRKGEEVVVNEGGGVTSTHIYMMPAVDEIDDPNIVKVDVHFVVIGVDKLEAEKHREELLAILRNWPTEAWGVQVAPITGEVSYITAGAVIGDQGAAFQLFALGEVLGFWKVLTPEVMGITGGLADQLAGAGMITISGLKVEDSQV